jgi:diphthamide biosynthesis protein 2
MLVDAPRVFERLRDGLRIEAKNETIQQLSAELDVEEKLCILGDTSYGACCVDEVAAEHVDADVVVHYGRSCLSPTARLPVIYVFTQKSLDLDAAVRSFKATYPDTNEKVCLMADIPYSHHLESLHDFLRAEGYPNLFSTHILHNPSSLIPNRTIPSDAESDAEKLKEYSIFHISNPPTSLLLILSSRIKSMHIFDPSSAPTSPLALEASTTPLLRRRYALLTRLSTVSIFGILINTLSVSNYMAALAHCQDLIAAAGKKSYVFVVGKVNAAKVANFSEIGGWVVIGCWESSLIESKEFYRPIITPFELQVALQGDETRTWGGEWIGDFSALLGGRREKQLDGERNEEENRHLITTDSLPEQDVPEPASDSDTDSDVPPEFDFRTGQYVSQSRPMHRHRPQTSTTTAPASSSALVSRPVADQQLTAPAHINGHLSPAAQFLREQRTWQGLGSDHRDIAYERDDDGRIIGAAMEEGRRGVAKGYTVGEDGRERT